MNVKLKIILLLVSLFVTTFSHAENRRKEEYVYYKVKSFSKLEYPLLFTFPYDLKPGSEFQLSYGDEKYNMMVNSDLVFPETSDKSTILTYTFKGKTSFYDIIRDGTQPQILYIGEHPVEIWIVKDNNKIKLELTFFSKDFLLKTPLLLQVKGFK